MKKIFTLLILLSFLSCDEDEKILSSQNKLLEFYVLKQENPKLKKDYQATIDGSIVSLMLPPKTDLSLINARVEVSKNATYNIDFFDYTYERSLSIFAEDNSVKTYKIRISSEIAVDSFRLYSNHYKKFITCKIKDSLIEATMPIADDISSLKVEVYPKELLHDQDEVNNFTKEVVYEFRDIHDVIKNYIVRVNQVNMISRFYLDGEKNQIGMNIIGNIKDSVIELYLPENVNLSNMNPDITYPSTSELTISSDKMKYTLKSKSGDTKEYKLIVKRSKIFKSKWQTTSARSVKLPLLTSGEYDFVVDWGDSEDPTIVTDINASHTYDLDSEYEIKIIGVLKGFNFSKSTGVESRNLLKISDFGDLQIMDAEGAFKDCQKLEITSDSLPNIEGITNLSAMFKNCFKLNADFTGWNVSKVTNMTELFSGAIIFNGDVTSWNVSKVTSMAKMFKGARAFNDYLGNWDVGEVRDFSEMFADAIGFNQYVSGWSVDSASNMSNMFNNAVKFNQAVSSWNTAKVTDMSGMFADAHAFNQAIFSNVAKVTNMQSMFENSIFNQDISSWNVSNVTNMASMFKNTSKFNQNIAGWNVAKVTDMSQMFENNDEFNQDISGWDVSKVTNMSEMFYQTRDFNTSVGAWNVTKVKDMSYMFASCGYNQSLSSWDVKNVTNMGYMFTNNRVFNQNITTWDVKKVVNMNHMFSGASDFSQSLILWKTCLISGRPEGFSDNATNMTEPDWNNKTGCN
jgi:surface protein